MLLLIGGLKKNARCIYFQNEFIELAQIHITIESKVILQHYYYTNKY